MERVPTWLWREPTWLSRRHAWLMIWLSLVDFALALTVVSAAVARGEEPDPSRWGNAAFLLLVAVNGFALGLGTLLPDDRGGKEARAATLPLGLLLLLMLGVVLALRLAAAGRV